MKPIAEALGISRSHLVTTLSNSENGTFRKSVSKNLVISDKKLQDSLKEIVKNRPSYGYRRACAILNRKLRLDGLPRLNHKRVYRVMKEANLLLPKCTGLKQERKHEGKVITLRSNTRWCSDSLQIRCWDGQKIDMAFIMDTCDREIISYVATTSRLCAKDVQNMLVMALEKRFPGSIKTSFSIEWLTDNGGIFTATDTKNVAKSMGLIPCQTPAYSPESNGMSESFVKRFKQDYVQINELWSAEEVMSEIPNWLNDYNENHPHKGLGMFSPREFLRANLK